MKNSILFFMLLGLIGLTSCSKEELASESSPNPALSVSPNLMGQHHNAILDAIGNDPDFSPQLLSGDLQPLAGKVVKYSDQYVGRPAGLTATAMTEAMGKTFLVLQSNPDLGKLGGSLHGDGCISKAERDFFDILDGIFLSTNNTSQGSLHQSLQNFERSVQQSPVVSDRIEFALVATATVMRYSDTYWRGVRAAGPNHPWYAHDQARIGSASGYPWYQADAMAAAEFLCSWEGLAMGPLAPPVAIGVATFASTVSIFKTYLWPFL